MRFRTDMIFRKTGFAWVFPTIATLLVWSGIVAVGQNRPLERAESVREEVLREMEQRGAASMSDDRDVVEDTNVDDTPFGVDLRSIHLISHQDKATMSAAPGSDPVVIDSELPAPEGLVARLTPFVGQPMSMKLLSEVGNEIVLAWRDSDYPLVDVYYPEQNITGGKLQVVVREAVLGDKSTDGTVNSKPEYLLSQLRVESGDRINRRVVESDLDWLNENPIRQVNLIYERGETDGTSDIVLDVTEENPLRAYAGFANTGVESTGEEEWSFGFNYYNPFQLEHMFGYHFATDLEWDNLEAHSFYYQAFLPWRHTLSFLGAYVSSESLPSFPTMVEGQSRQFSIEYRIPLERPSFNRNWRHSITAAFDYKSTNTDLIFGGFTFFGTDVQVGQFRTAYDVLVRDDSGVTRAAVGFVASPGDMFDNNDDFSFGLARAGSTADYFYAFAELERLQDLPGGAKLRFKMHAQGSSDRLSSTEQLLAGGYQTVRGFDESLIRGDSGILTTLELISPDFSLCNSLGGPGGDTWNGILFWDAAALDISDALPGEISPSIQSIGLGLNCRFSDWGTARAAYGWEVQSHGLLPTDDDGGKFHFGFTLIY
ncbi:MAG: hypothetical protein CMO55_05885 [Verrucomicrobiales bacterium]|nr:hypothetical protein [Verrucomicrobiales bacterium]